MTPQPANTPQNAKYAGIVFETGGSYLVLPSLSLKRAEELSEQMDTAADASKPWKDRKEAMLAVILEAAKRNYPTMTMDDIMEHFSLDTLKGAYEAAQGMTTSPKTHNAAGEFKAAAKNG